jgi:hypothetical protein
MVAGFFRQISHPVDEEQRGAEILELKGSYQLPSLDMPSRKRFELGSDLLIGKRGHDFSSKRGIVRLFAVTPGL